MDAEPLIGALKDVADEHELDWKGAKYQNGLRTAVKKNRRSQLSTLALNEDTLPSDVATVQGWAQRRWEKYLRDRTTFPHKLVLAGDAPRVSSEIVLDTDANIRTERDYRQALNAHGIRAQFVTVRDHVHGIGVQYTFRLIPDPNQRTIMLDYEPTGRSYEGPLPRRPGYHGEASRRWKQMEGQDDLPETVDSILDLMHSYYSTDDDSRIQR